jgi:hypothetical protein
MTYIEIGVLGANDFKNAVIICVHLLSARAHAKNLQS